MSVLHSKHVSTHTPYIIHQDNLVQLSLSEVWFNRLQLPFSSQEWFTVDDGTAINPFALTDSGGPSTENGILVGSEFLIGDVSEIPSWRSSMRFKDGTSPLQYLRHMFRYVDSRPSAKLGPSQTGDFNIRSLRLVLKFARAGISKASCKANRTYSSSSLATRCPSPAWQLVHINLRGYMKPHPK